MWDLFYLPTPEAFTVFNRLVKPVPVFRWKLFNQGQIVAYTCCVGWGLVIDMLAILKTLILRNDTAGKLVSSLQPGVGRKNIALRNIFQVNHEVEIIHQI